ncbi:hypothetical protein JQ628_05020 [Bradyrhizobium lablabi]|uniref:hypothetical protein n=1 Tax=Bradyrhizobium lablabi TaxID=722472 RepID=UPI001BA4F52C|nr:hypothetical protein [Bradyrhizobium lablabi]MBR1120870.1 hypothetical protein [Bradyrhizobium lablabi]
MTTTKDDYVTDAHGRRVRRRNDDVLADGQVLRVPMILMDTVVSDAQVRAMHDAAAQLENHQLSAFADAVNGGASFADAVAKAKALKRIEQFDARGHRPGFVFDHSPELSAARDQYHARTHDRWKASPEQSSLTADEKAALGVASGANDHKPHTVIAPNGSNYGDVRAAADRVIENRDKRLEAAWQR